MPRYTQQVNLYTVAIKENPKNELSYDPQHYEFLKGSIKKIGITTPLTVYGTGDGYVVTNGNTRLRIAKELGLETVPCFVLEPPTDDADEYIQILDGNLARTTEKDTDELILMAKHTWDLMEQTQKEKETKLLLEKFKKTHEEGAEFKPQYEFIRQHVGRPYSNSTIKRSIKQATQPEEELTDDIPEEAKPKKKKGRTFDKFCKAAVTELEFLVSENAPEMLDEDVVAEIGAVIDILSKYSA